MKAKRLVESSNNIDFYREVTSYFSDSTYDDEFFKVCEDIVERAFDKMTDSYNEDPDLYEMVWEACDDGLIYNADQWTVAQFYCGSPADLNWDSVFEEFTSDIAKIVSDLVGSSDESDEDDEE